ncbi:alcohol dehydrogenase family protein [Paraburkholderia caribensis]|uniref:Alcohol dehydrogenase family protein n=2 Tax=Paraburkholderia caribensis TaxID=75105 RepID=A0ABV0DPD8_9BURK|nr:alcohol dehydrogenase family protein [Paraburkholderia caribensis]MCO4878279.1 alcohol dehydrogenase family protein [Paraburkholderia caribensis]PTB28620.1 alcohol dehydrogenase [Paraburkholderia caribensis]
MSNTGGVVPETMRAVHLTGYGGIEKLVYREDVATPQPQNGEVLIKVGACGLNNTDVNLRTRWYHRSVNESLSEQVALTGAKGAGAEEEQGNASWNQESIVFPRIQGAAIAGRIVAVGPSVDAGRVGERVLVDPQVRDLSLPLRAQLIAYLGGDRDGGFAEYAVVPAANAYPLSSSLTDAELATFPTSYDTAEEMLVRARLSEGETVVITGAAGGVGTALIQLAHIRKARVIAIAGKSKEERIRELGAHAFVPREVDNLRGAVEKIVGPQGVDVVADVVGGPMFGDLLKLLRRGGRYSTAGAIAGPVQPLDLRDLIYKDLEMYGITCPTPETFAQVVGYVESGQLRPLVDRVFDLSDLREAQGELVKRAHVGKLVVVP